MNSTGVDSGVNKTGKWDFQKRDLNAGRHNIYMLQYSSPVYSLQQSTLTNLYLLLLTRMANTGHKTIAASITCDIRPANSNMI